MNKRIILAWVLMTPLLLSIIVGMVFMCINHPTEGFLFVIGVLFIAGILLLLEETT